MQENYKDFKEPNIVDTCLLSGICTTEPILNAIEEILYNEIRQISYYLVKLDNFGFYDENIAKKCIQALTYELASTDINENYLKSVLAKLVELKTNIKEKYLDFCKNSPQGCEIINFSSEINYNKKLTQLVKEGEKLLQVKNRTLNLGKIRYFELINIIAKTSAQNLAKIWLYDDNYNEYNFTLLKFFSLTNLYHIKEEKLKKKIYEFSSITYNIRDKLNKVLDEYFEGREACEIQTTLSRGKSLLVSGCNIKELENVLIALKNKKVNVYTHGELLRAHSYKKIQKFKNLKGHYDTGSIKVDFSNFKGVIYVTKFMQQKIEQVYQGIIFSSEEITPKGVIRIENNNYKELIKYIDKYQRSESSKNIIKANLKYDLNVIDKVFKQEKKSVVMFVGDTKNFNFLETFGEKKVINISYQTDSDLMHYILDKSEETNIPVIVFFSKCSKRLISDIVSLLNKNVIEIYLIRCQNANISPHLIECLKDNFKVKIIN